MFILNFNKMKNVKLLLMLGTAALLAACSNEADSLTTSIDAPVTASIDLQSVSYTDLATQLNDVSDFGKMIILKDNGFNRQVHVSMDKRTKIQLDNENVRLFNGRDKDSTSFILGDEFAVLRFYRNGESISYIAYKEAQMMNEIAEFYAAPFKKTRAINEKDAFECIYDSRTRSAGKDIVSVKINIDKAKKILNLPECDYINDYIKTPQVPHGITESQTRAVPSEPKTVYVICLRENGSTIYPNEVSAQMQDAANSVYAVHGLKRYVNFHFVLYTTEYSCPSGDAKEGLEGFTASLKSNPKAEGYDDQIYFLIRWGTWDNNILGMSWFNSYNVNTASDFEASGMSTTQLMYPGVMAHELGHILGAEHTDNSKDLMYATFTGYLSHLSEKNMDIIAKNLGWEAADGD